MVLSSTHNASAAVARPVQALRFGRESGADRDWSVEWRLQRNCSLAPVQLLMVFLGLCTVSLAISSMFWWQGVHMVLPFAGAEMLAVGVAMLVYARHAADREWIALRRGSLTVEQAIGSRLERIEFEPGWVRVEPESGHRSLVELSGQGRRVAVGRFVRPEYRGQLADELRRAVQRSRVPGALR